MNDNFSKESQARYLAELRVGDRPWAAFHPCHDRAPGLGPEAVEQVTVVPSPKGWEPPVVHILRDGDCPPKQRKLLGVKPEHASWGLYPTREMAIEARRIGMEQEGDRYLFRQTQKS